MQWCLNTYHFCTSGIFHSHFPDSFGTANPFSDSNQSLSWCSHDKSVGIDNYKVWSESFYKMKIITEKTWNETAFLSLHSSIALLSFKFSFYLLISIMKPHNQFLTQHHLKTFGGAVLMLCETFFPFSNLWTIMRVCWEHKNRLNEAEL